MKPEKPSSGRSKPKAASKTDAAKPQSAAPAKVAPPAPTTIPPILLEGDAPSKKTPAGPGERYSLGTSRPPEHPVSGTAAELPESYGTKRLLLTARDPHWLYARWDLTREQQREYNALSTDHHLVLRIFLNEVSEHAYNEVHVHPESTHWFVHVAAAGSKYFAQLGFYHSKTKWNAISTSAATMTPPDDLSVDTSADFATIPVEIPFATIMELAKTAVLENIPLAEVVAQLRASGHQIPEPHSRPRDKWTPERERALASIITMDQQRRVWMGSLEITELLRRQLHQELSSIAAAQLSQPTSPTLGGVTSVSSPFGGVPSKQKGFWFNINAELIIYGATEPDAEVRIGGRVIKLRPDGTFSYRFILPDGQYDLFALATSNDKTDSRAAELNFSRATDYHGDVGAHPQDPAMKPPLVQNVF